MTGWSPRSRATSHIQYTFPCEQEMRLTASPSGSYWVGWTTSKIFIADSSVLTAPRALRLNGSTFPKKDDLLTVAFKDDFILMTGHRSGFIYFIDHREPQSCTARLLHDSPVNALMCLKHDHLVLVNGMTTTKLYDLRYVAAPTKRQRRSKPFLTFAIGSRTSDRLGLGLDYYQELNIVAIASSRIGSHHVTFYSTRTGKVIPSALNDAEFGGPIPCLKFDESQTRPRSLLMIPDAQERKVIAWSCDPVVFSARR